jgi:hypothetical protein
VESVAFGIESLVHTTTPNGVADAYRYLPNRAVGRISIRFSSGLQAATAEAIGTACDNKKLAPAVLRAYLRGPLGSDREMCQIISEQRVQERASRE